MRITVVLSDGEQNTEYGGAAAAIESALELKDSLITVFAVGFGADVDTNTLEQMSSEPVGQHSYL